MAHLETKQHLANWHTGQLAGANSTTIRTFTQSQFQVYFRHHYVWFTGNKDTENKDSCMMDSTTSYNITAYRMNCLGVAVSVMRIYYCFSNILIPYKYTSFMTYPLLQFHFPRNNCIMIILYKYPFSWTYRKTSKFFQY